MSSRKLKNELLDESDRGPIFFFSPVGKRGQKSRGNITEFNAIYQTNLSVC